MIIKYKINILKYENYYHRLFFKIVSFFLKKLFSFLIFGFSFLKIKEKFELLKIYLKFSTIEKPKFCDEKPSQAPKRTNRRTKRNK